MRYIAVILTIFSLATALLSQENSKKANGKISAQSKKPVVIFFFGEVTISELPSKKNVNTYAGMVLNDKSILKTGSNSMARVGIGNVVYTIKKNSAVSIDAILKIEPDRESDGMRTLFDKSRYKEKTVSAGIRAEEKKESISWAEDDRSEENQDPTADLIEGMKALLSIDDYGKAALLYEKNSDKKGKFSLECKYLAAISQLNLCRYREAGVLFEAVAKSSDSPLAADALYNSGLCSYSLLDYKKAISSLNAYVGRFPKGTFAPQAYFLLGKSYAATNNEASASVSFKVVMEKFSSDPIAAYAEEEYKEISK